MQVCYVSKFLSDIIMRTQECCLWFENCAPGVVGVILVLCCCLSRVYCLCTATTTSGFGVGKAGKDLVITIGGSIQVYHPNKWIFVDPQYWLNLNKLLICY